jgi:hypothetical protein
VSAADSFGWVEDDPALTAACFTALVGVDPDEAAQRLGGDLATRRLATFADAFNEYPETAYLVVDELAGGVLVAENNGWEGATPEVVGPASAGGRLASVYWSVNADMTFVYAVGGQVTAMFDPLLFEGEWWTGDPGSLGASIDDLPFGVASPRAASFALIERLVGLRLERSWLAQPHPCFDVQPR